MHAIHIKRSLIAAAALATFSSTGGIPVTWTVETTRATTPTIQAYQGETLALEATMTASGEPLELTGDAAIYWQTNGMGSSYWSAPATAESSRLAAVWTPEMDVGASNYHCFIGIPGQIYRAAFQLRLRTSPGASPNTLPLPPKVIDFATVEVRNPPWGDPMSADAVTNIAEHAVDRKVPAWAKVPDPPFEGCVKTNEYGALAVGEIRSTAPTFVLNDCSDYRLMLYPDQIWSDIYGPLLFPWSDMYGMDNTRDIAVRSMIPHSAEDIGGATSAQLASVDSTASAALSYSASIYQYMTGNTNAWFAGTNYVVTADGTTRTKFAWEDGMDGATVPCSMSLWEIRDGVRQCVWDQRDWTVWYWSFKAQQMRGEIAAANRLLYAAITNAENHAWAKHYAATGRRNPDASTTYIDTPSVTLSPGMSWETVATVSGCGYWTIVGNGAVIGGSGTNATLNIKDFEGNSILEITKGKHMLAWLESSDFVGQMYDTERWVCFDMMADMKPTGYFSTTLVAADFVAETDENCPAQYRWEDLGGHVWRVHYLLKPGIVSDACFAKFQVEVEGKAQIRYNADTVINGGLIFDGVKIAPVIQSGAAVGSTVTWKVVQ